jgi:hypothetical protein
MERWLSGPNADIRRVSKETPASAQHNFSDEALPSNNGEVAERLKAAVLKTVKVAIPS